MLQNIVNEFGQRLNFDVEHGLYQRKKTAIGFDGIWRTKNQPEQVNEVKTTDIVKCEIELSYHSVEHDLIARGNYGKTNRVFG